MHACIKVFKRNRVSEIQSRIKAKKCCTEIEQIDILINCRALLMPKIRQCEQEKSLKLEEKNVLQNYCHFL